MPKFELGRTVATPAALQVLEQAGVSALELLDRHMSGDWGDLTLAGRVANQMALLDGSRILSAYRLPDGQKIWIITEAVGPDGHRAATTILLPSDY